MQKKRMKIFPIRIKSGIYILLLCIIAACSVCCAEQDYYVEGNAEQLNINILEKKEKPQEKKGAFAGTVHLLGK